MMDEREAIERAIDLYRNHCREGPEREVFWVNGGKAMKGRRKKGLDKNPCNDKTLANPGEGVNERTFQSCNSFAVGKVRQRCRRG